MRIPWYIYTPLSLLVILLTLYLCVKDIDTVTPPNPQTTSESIKEWRKDNPSIRDTKLKTAPRTQPKVKPVSAEPKIKPTATPEDVPEVAPKPTPIAKTPTISPALSSMTQQNLSTQQLTVYADHMLKSNKPQLARIAYERIIDYAKDASEDDRKLAASTILKLTSKTPLWNPDPSVRKKINITITTNKKYHPSLKTLTPQLETLIFDASDGMLNPTIKLTLSSAPLSSISIANTNSPVRFTIKDSSNVSPKIHAALYNIIRNKNNQSQNLISIPTLPTHIPPQQALKSHITRLAWVNASK